MAQDEIGFLENYLEKEDWPTEHQKKADAAIENLKQFDLRTVLENPDVKKAIGSIFESADSGVYNFRVLANGRRTLWVL